MKPSEWYLRLAVCFYAGLAAYLFWTAYFNGVSFP